MASYYTTTVPATTAAATATAVTSDLSFGCNNLYLHRRERHWSCPVPTHRRWLPVRVTGCHNRTPEAVLTTSKSVMPVKETCDGAGIAGFLRGKNYFITGATGFVAKVFIEKLIRATPGIGKIFLLIKAKDQDAAKSRLYKEIISSEIFEVLKQTYGKSYETFMLNKLIPVVGDIAEDNLGMDDETAKRIAKEIDLLVSSAASTAFNERYDVALNINAVGPSRLISFAKRCKKLNLFLHFSTAYVNGNKQGIVPETPFSKKQSITSDLKTQSEVKLASDMARTFQDREVTKKMKEMGLERAKLYGWKDTYTFTKALGEMTIESLRGDLPIVIIRPTIIESSYREPFPGWIQGNRAVDPLILGYGKGQLPGLLGHPQTVMDIVPVDMVVNATMAAMARHGKDAKAKLKVYHVGSSAVNPLLLHELFEFTRQLFRSSPLRNSNGEKITIEPMKFYRFVEDFSSFISSDVVARQDPKPYSTTSETKRKKKTEQLVGMAKLYEPYLFIKARFDNSNTRTLLEDMSIEDRKMFGFDTGSINWEHYLVDVHVPGLKRHVLLARGN